MSSESLTRSVVGTKLRANRKGWRRSALFSLRLHPATPLVAVLVLVIGFVIHGPYLSAPLILDDITTLDLQGQLLTGRTTLFAYVFTFFETLHLQATWKLVLLGVAKCWGIWPVPYHVLVIGSQAASAFLLYLFLSRQGTSRVVAALGAVLWSGAAFGRWDNVLLFVNSGSHVFSLCFLLAAMLLLRAMSRNPTTTNTLLFVVAEVGVILSFSSDTIFLGVADAVVAIEAKRPVLERVFWPGPFRSLSASVLNSR
ncbi:MAG: hypothetical protein U1D30_17930 [Planctomycetota bacterium]